MPTFEIVQYETWAHTYRLEGSSKAEALASFMLDQVVVESMGGSVFVETNEDVGMPTDDDNAELAEAVAKLGVWLRDDWFNSIASIEEVAADEPAREKESKP